MTEPTAPTIPADAPQDVKDSFDCRGNRLVWRSGEVTWLGLMVTPKQASFGDCVVFGTPSIGVLNRRGGAVARSASVVASRQMV